MIKGKANMSRKNSKKPTNREPQYSSFGIKNSRLENENI
jgi:hypothetical protein